MVAPYPVKRLHFGVGIFKIFCPPMLVSLVNPLGSALDWVQFHLLVGKPVGVGKLPWIFHHGGVIFEMFHVSAAFKDQSLESFLRELFGCPPPAYSGAD